MPVYEISYKSYEGEVQPLIKRLLSFPKYTYMQYMNRKIIHTTFILAWLPFILFIVYIYLRVNIPLLKNIGIPVNAIPEVNSKFFLIFILTQLPFILFFTLSLGPSLISTDLKHKALPMILSKPIGKWEYLFGKFMVLFIILSLLTWVQGCVLFIMNTLAVPSASEWRQMFFTETIQIFFNTIIFSVVIITTMNLLVLTFSSLTNTPSFASVSLIMYIIGTSIISGILRNIFKSDLIPLISPINFIAMIGGMLFKVDQNGSYFAWLAVLSTWGICILILSTRVRAFQVHKD